MSYFRRWLENHEEWYTFICKKCVAVFPRELNRSNEASELGKGYL